MDNDKVKKKSDNLERNLEEAIIHLLYLTFDRPPVTIDRIFETVKLAPEFEEVTKETGLNNRLALLEREGLIQVKEGAVSLTREGLQLSRQMYNDACNRRVLYNYWLELNDK